MKELLSSQRYRLLLGFATIIPTGLAVASGWLFYRTSTGTAEALTWVRNTHALIHGVDTAVRLAVDAETGQRGFLLTGNREFLAPYEQALAELPGVTDELRRRSAPEKRNAKLAARLQEAVAAKLEDTRHTVELARLQGVTEAARLAASGPGQALMDEVRQVARTFTTANETELQLQREHLREHLDRSHLVMIGMIAAEIILCAVIVFLLWQVSRARGLTLVCAWSKTVEYGGEWISFEEYLYRRFGIQASHGISPAEAQKLRRAISER